MMGYEPCPICAAITTDQRKHADEHKALADALAYLLAAATPVAGEGRSRSWSGPDVTPLPETPTATEVTQAASLRDQAEAAFSAFDTAMASLTAYKEVVQQTLGQPAQGQVNDQVYSLTVILEGVLRASNGLARLALRRFNGGA